MDPFNPSQSILQRIPYSDNVNDSEKSASQLRKIQSSPFLHRVHSLASPITSSAAVIDNEKVREPEHERERGKKNKRKRMREIFTPEELPIVNLSSYHSSQSANSLSLEKRPSQANNIDKTTKKLCQRAMLLLASLTGKSRTLIIHALIIHSGDIANAYFYLTQDRMEKCWLHEEDIDILQNNFDKVRDKWSEKDIATRSAFLNALCEAPN